MDLSPAFTRLKSLVATDHDDCSIAIYVEPPDAPGLYQILPVLQEKLDCERKEDVRSSRYATLTGVGLKHLKATSSAVDDIRDEPGDGPELYADIQYRMFVVDVLRPVGYCCFTVKVTPWEGFEVDLDEVWLEAPYRGRGIGSALAHKVAAMAMFSLRELDAKAFERLDEPLELPIVVGGDVYSKSGEQFVESVADILHDEIGLSDWQALSTGSFIWDARW
jgi:ribosomal protein S18 acetylase RimI-like enzyme